MNSEQIERLKEECSHRRFMSDCGTSEEPAHTELELTLSDQCVRLIDHINTMNQIIESARLFRDNMRNIQSLDGSITDKDFVLIDLALDAQEKMKQEQEQTKGKDDED